MKMESENMYVRAPPDSGHIKTQIRDIVRYYTRRYTDALLQIE